MGYTIGWGFLLYLEPVKVVVKGSQLGEERLDTMQQLRSEEVFAGRFFPDAGDIALPGKIWLQIRVVCCFGSLIQVSGDGNAGGSFCVLDQTQKFIRLGGDIFPEIL